MHKIVTTSLLALSLSVLHASAASAFGSKALFNRADPTEIGDHSETSPFVNSLLRAPSESPVANISVAPLPQAAVSTLSEGFENVNSLSSSGWTFINNSDPAPFSPQFWTQGVTSTSNYAAQSGPANSYAQVDFQSTVGDGTQANGTISNWLITPELDFSQGGTVTFYARTFGGNSRPELIEVRQSSAGASSNVGTLATDLGDFTTLTGAAGGLTSNEIAPAPNAIPSSTWRLYTFNVAATGGTGRLAFRYFATDGGVNGTQAQYATIDTFNYTAVPEPVTSSMAGFAALGLASYFKGKRKRTTI
jgi:hypothetical protein